MAESRLDLLLAKTQRLASQLGVESDFSLLDESLKRGIGDFDSNTSGDFNSFGSKITTTEKEKKDAVLLLAQSNFDAVRFASQVNNISVENRYDPTERLEGIDLDGYLAHHHDMIVLNAIDSTNKITEEYIRNVQRKHLADDWARTRKTFIESLGNVTQHWARKGPLQQAVNNATATSNLATFQPFNVPSFRSFNPNNIINNNNRGTTDATTTTSAALSSLLLDGWPELLRKHAPVIRRMNLCVNDFVSSPCRPCFELLDTITTPYNNNNNSGKLNVSGEDVGLSNVDLIGYQAVLEMLGTMVGESRFRVVPSGLFSTVAFPPSVDDGGTTTTALLQSIAERKQYLSLGAMEYFEQQQRNKCNQDIDMCLERGFIDRSFDTKTTATTTHIPSQRLKAYVHYLWKTGNLYSSDIDPRFIALSSYNNGALQQQQQHVHQMIPIWPLIYFCLTLGDIDLAVKELSNCLDNNNNTLFVEQETLVVLTYFQRLFKHFSASSTTATTTTMNGSTALSRKVVSDVLMSATTTALSRQEINDLVHAMNHCKDLYNKQIESPLQQQQQHQQHDSYNHLDCYKLLVLNLLSLSDKEQLPDPGISSSLYSLQNYLWANLWFVTLERWLTTTTTSNNNNNNTATAALLNYTKNSSEGESWLYGTVLDFGGETHFDANNNNPLKYTIVLLTCQRYGDAIVHLWNSGKAVVAVHLLAVCLYYGLVLPQSPLKNNPPFSHALFSRELTTTSNDSLLFPSAMLQFFFNHQQHPQQQFPVVVVSWYLLTLQSSWAKNVGVEELGTALFEQQQRQQRNIVSSVFEKFLISLNQQQLTQLVGVPATATAIIATSATKGSLHDFLSREEVNVLLVRCANQLLTVHKESETAIYFFQLANRFVDALDELCHQLSLVVVAVNMNKIPTKVSSSMSANRQHWIDVSVQFFEAYVKSGTGPLTENLQVNPRNDLLQLFVQLLNLSMFVTCCCNQQWLEAMSIIDEVTLFPRNNSELRNAVMAFQSYSKSASYLARLIDDLVILYMECLVNSNSIRQQQAQATILTFVQQQDMKKELENFKERGEALAAFCSSVSHYFARPDTLKAVTLAQRQIV